MKTQHSKTLLSLLFLYQVFPGSVADIVEYPELSRSSFARFETFDDQFLSHEGVFQDYAYDSDYLQVWPTYDYDYLVTGLDGLSDAGLECRLCQLDYGTQNLVPNTQKQSDWPPVREIPQGNDIGKAPSGVPLNPTSITDSPILKAPSGIIPRAQPGVRNIPKIPTLNSNVGQRPNARGPVPAASQRPHTPRFKKPEIMNTVNIINPNTAPLKPKQKTGVQNTKRIPATAPEQRVRQSRVSTIRPNKRPFNVFNRIKGTTSRPQIATARVIEISPPQKIPPGRKLAATPAGRPRVRPTMSPRLPKRVPPTDFPQPPRVDDVKFLLNGEVLGNKEPVTRSVDDSIESIVDISDPQSLPVSAFFKNEEETDVPREDVEEDEDKNRKFYIFKAVPKE